MKRTILIFGLLYGGVLAANMLLMVTQLCNPDFEGGMWLGYATMLVISLFIPFGIRNYRNKQLGGYISFGRALGTGLLLALIGGTFYVVAWLFCYYLYMPDFMDVYVQNALDSAAKSGKSAEEITKMANDMKEYQEMYKTPVGVILLTYMEVLPVGIIVAFISALILKKKPLTAQL